MTQMIEIKIGDNGRGDLGEMGVILTSLLPLFVMLFGFYVMFSGGLFRRK